MPISTVKNTLPAELLIGPGALKELNVPAGKTLLITDQGLLGTDIPGKVKSLLGEAEIYSDLAAEPTTDDLDRALQFARDGGFQNIVGVGGGSALDIAKAVAGLLKTTCKAADMLGNQPDLVRSTYFAAIATTAGTGSESTLNAIFVDSSDGVKKAIISPALLPDVAVLDAELTTSLPAHITASTGVDALCHCVESFISVKANAVSETYSLRGIDLIEKNLKTAVEEPGNLTARQNMLVASYYGGAALAIAGTTAVHALAYPLGKRGIPHGVANSMLFCEVMRTTLGAFGERFLQLGHGEVDAKAVLERIGGLVKSLPIPASVAKYGIVAADLDALAQEAMEQTRLLNNHPGKMTLAQAKAIYAALM